MVEQGEVRRASAWPFLGSEPSGERPVLIVSPSWFNANHNPIAIPLTSQWPNRAYPWQPYLPCTHSWVLIPAIKTVSVHLGRSILGLASPDDLDNIAFHLSNLISPSESAWGLEASQGEVWEVDLLNPGNHPHPVKALVLRYDNRNGMAMTLRVGNRRDGLLQLEIPVNSCTALAGQSVYVDRVWPLSFHDRFRTRVGWLSDAEMESVVESFQRLVAPSSTT